MRGRQSSEADTIQKRDKCQASDSTRVKESKRGGNK